MPVEARAEVAGAVIPAVPLCPIDVAGEELENTAHSSRKVTDTGKGSSWCTKLCLNLLFFLYYITVPPI